MTKFIIKKTYTFVCEADSLVDAKRQMIKTDMEDWWTEWSWDEE